MALECLSSLPVSKGACAKALRANSRSNSTGSARSWFERSGTGTRCGAVSAVCSGDAEVDARILSGSHRGDGKLAVAVEAHLAVAKKNAARTEA